MVTTEIWLLGPPMLMKAGRPVRLHSAKTLSLLAYLSLEDDMAHSREKLAGLLWGENPESRARQSLRQALYSLRQVLGTDAFALDGGAVSFEPRPGIWVDALEFQVLVGGEAESDGLDALGRAADLYRGVLLEGSEPSDCPTFDEWLFFQRDGLEQHAMGTLQSLVDGLLEQGDLQDALAHAQRLVTLDPLHEGAHRRLMRIHSSLGDRDGVRRQYRLCADVLERELGAAPAGDTEALYRQLIAVQPTPTILHDQPSPPRLEEQALTLPFLGREKERTVLADQFDRAVQGKGRLVLVSGEAGVGKTRLVEEFLGRCAGRTEQPADWPKFGINNWLAWSRRSAHQPMTSRERPLPKAGCDCCRASSRLWCICPRRAFCVSGLTISIGRTRLRWNCCTMSRGIRRINRCS